MRVLMCPPLYFEIAWENPEHNPWMNRAEQPRFAQALAQWAELVDWYRENGVIVEFIDAVPHLPDMVFAANAGWVHNGMFIYGELAPPPRKNETFHYRRRFDVQMMLGASNGVNCVFKLPDEMCFEGQGDIIETDAAYLYCHGSRNDPRVPEMLRKVTQLDRPMLTLRLAPNSGFYHGDLALFYVREAKTLLWCPEAFDALSADLIRSLKIPNQIEIPKKFAMQDLGNGKRNFLLNGVDIGTKIILPQDLGGSPDDDEKSMEENIHFFFSLRRKLHPISTHFHNFSEFGKSGAGIGCATLVLER